MLKKLFTFLFLISIGSTSFCQAAENNKNNHVSVQLIADVTSIKAGTPFLVAADFTLEKDWHIYWQNPGDSGIPTTINWTLPENFSAGPIQWPYPKRISLPPLMTYGYEDRVLLLSNIVPPPTLDTSSPVTLKAQINWLMCKVICIPGKAQVSLTLPVNSSTSELNLQTSKYFINTRLALPLETSDWDISGYDHDKKITLILKNKSQEKYNLNDIYFFPFKDDLVQHAQKQIITQTNDGYTLTIPKSTLSTTPIKELQGVLYSSQGWRGAGSEKALSLDIPVSNVPPMTQILNNNHIKLPLALLFAFIGGLILNLMPCVLPVLSIKVLSLIKHSNESKATLLLHGLTYSLGVIACFWMLAITLIIFRQTGLHIGWGFQFQSPLFLIFLSTVFFVFALNLFGVFEINLPFQMRLKQQHSALSGSFFNGILATVTATPCTAPFMGAALGFALSQTPLISLSIFTALGFGLAFPFLLLTLFPVLLKFLPKPGPWMMHFKRFLGILLIGTMLWLLWILGSQLGILKDTSNNLLNAAHKISWETYSPELIENLRAQKRLIFIDFTAKWCLSCQVNERIALENPTVVQKIKELNVVMVKADWTLQDATITQALASYGKNSIPLYVLYGENALQEPTILPEILTPKIVLEALENIIKKPTNK